MAFGSRSLPPLLPDEEGILGAEVRLEVGARVTSLRRDGVEVKPGPAEAELEEDEVAANSDSPTLGLFGGGGRSGLDEAGFIYEMNLAVQRQGLWLGFPANGPINRI